eukprot:scaffold20482_cov23-Cyclotella_meneghiniana.AAC.2
MIKYKISLLEDAKSLPGRLQILNYLVEDKPEAKLDVLVALQHRQCGVLRWMVEKKLLDLDSDVKSAGLSLANFRFIKRMPSMTLGSFLCFAAVEYDDLFSLQWLCETHSCISAKYEGMNLLHTAALFGRIEIAAWLCSTSAWQALQEPSTHKEYAGASSVHIAAGQGHIILADMLLKFGCNACDSSNKGPECYAKKAPILTSVSFQRDYKFAHDWARDRSDESILDPDHAKNITKLLQLMKKKKSLKSLKEHIINTHCLDIDLWNQSGFFTFDQVDPNGMSYGLIVDKCLSFHDRSFAVWIITFLTARGKEYKKEIFWSETDRFGFRSNEKRLNQNDLLLWAKEESQQMIVDALSYCLIQNVECVDPQNDLMFSLPSMGTSELSVYLRSKLIWARTLVAIQSCIRYESVAAVVLKGGNPGELARLINMYEEVCSLLNTSGIFRAAKDETSNQLLLEMDMISELKKAY